MKISLALTEKLSYIFLSLPLFLFLIIWLNPIAAVISVCILSALIFLLVKDAGKNHEYIEISKEILFFTIIIAIVWLLLGGVGGFDIGYQNAPDWNIKNAVMHDLINFKLPVVYDNGVRLTYYVGFILPAALVGKLLVLTGFSHETAFKFSNYFLLIWSVIGMILVFIHLYSLVKVEDCKKLLLIFLFIIFSGLDIVLPYIQNIDPLHLEWHYESFSYTSNTALLFYAFNQAIVSWIIIMMFMKNPINLSNLGFYSVISIFYAPFIALGLSIYFLAVFFKELIVSICNKKFYDYFVSAFNLKNILSLLIFILLMLYFSSNDLGSKLDFSLKPVNKEYLSFVFAEAVIFILLLLKANYKNFLYWIMTISLIMIPLINACNFQNGVDISPDICMRSSVASLIVLFILVSRYLFENTISVFDKITKRLLVICIIIAAVTPMFEFTRNIFNVRNNISVCDEVRTLNNKIDINNCHWIDGIGNYCYYGASVSDDKIFWKYLSKK